MSIDQERITELHRRAMRLAHEGAEATDAGSATQAYAGAFEEEREAAALLATALDVEPTRAVLYRSATSLGIRCHRIQEAYEVLMNGLASRSREIVAELRELQQELDHTLGAGMRTPAARRDLERTWDAGSWRQRMPEVLAAYLGKMDHYLELNGIEVEEAKEIVLLALERLWTSDAWLRDVADLDLALFDLLHQLCAERRPQRGPSD